MLQRVILKLKEAGITEMVVNVHHFAQQIIDFIDEHDRFGINIHISDESDCLLDTGGGILAARQWLEDDDFVVHNADILTDFPVEQMIAAHLQARTECYAAQSVYGATLLVARRQTSRYFLFDSQRVMHGWENITTGEVRPAGLSAAGLEPLAFGGVHIVTPEIFPALEDYAKRGKVFSIATFYTDTCDCIKYTAYIPGADYTWLDIGRPESLDRANALFL